MPIAPRRLIMDFRPGCSFDISKALDKHGKWESIRECCAIVLDGQSSPILDILRECNAYIHVFDGYNGVGGLLGFEGKTIILSNDVIFEQVIEEKIEIWSYIYNKIIIKNKKYKRAKYKGLDNEGILRAISVFGLIPGLSQMKAILSSRHFKRYPYSRPARFWQREAGKEVIAKIRIGTVPPCNIGVFDSIGFLCKWKKSGDNSI